MTQITRTPTSTTKTAQADRFTLSNYSKTKLQSRPQLVMLLADISGSMGGEKIRALNKALGDIWRPNFSCVGFGAQLYEIEQSDVGNIPAGGGTPMRKALNVAWDEGATHIVLLTDGFPTDADSSDILLEVGNRTSIPIDTVGISEGKQNRSYNPDFLRKISELTGGRYMEVDQPLELTATLQFLLDYGPDELQKGGSIQL